MSLTGSQKTAVAARGQVLVMAGAGTGKTSTLIDHTLHCLRQDSPRISLDQILIVTFTEDAAAEMRHRLRQALQNELAQTSDPTDAAYWREQLAIFDAAHVGTLHSFCLKLIRQHFYELNLDPELKVLPEDEIHLVTQEALDDLLETKYSSGPETLDRIKALVALHGGHSDARLRGLILRLHRYAQTLPDPDAWFAEQRQFFSGSTPDAWRAWILDALAGLLRELRDELGPVRAENKIAAACLDILDRLPARFTRDEAKEALRGALSCVENPPRGKKGKWVEPYKRLIADMRFLECLLRDENGADPLLEDWQWMRTSALTLLDLASDFGKLYATRKAELGAVDFHDLEQYTLRLLHSPGGPTPTAVHWQSKLRHVFVDEYQDINAAQDKILECLSGSGPGANRFLVGDVKQSIYRFRLADPKIFQRYARDWRTSGQVIPFQDNFRSHPGILRFVNALFSNIMHPAVGGVAYDSEAELRPGRASEAQSDDVRVEWHVLLCTKKSTRTNGDEGESEELEDLESAEKEALMVCSRIEEIVRAQYPIFDKATKQVRPAQWRDVAILLRSLQNKTECYAKVFARRNVPLIVNQGGFYESMEVRDILSLLQTLDNPRQDIPLLAVLRSPIVSMTPEDLVKVRLASPGRYWTALGAFSERKGDDASSAPLKERVRQFLDRHRKWRELAREASLSRCLHHVLADTNYEGWLAGQSRPEQRQANVQRLLDLAHQFDQFHRQGLFRFMRFIEAQQDAKAEPKTALESTQDAVRVLSIHRSKGLEFPIVVVPDLAKNFNEQDLRGGIILDDEYGLCPRIQPPEGGPTYPSLSHFMGKKKQALELRGEELRLLYVAATRARELLILTTRLSPDRFDSLSSSSAPLTPTSIARARSYNDWFMAWFSNQGLAVPLPRAGSTDLLRWNCWDEAQLAPPSASDPVVSPVQANAPTYPEEVLSKLRWKYPFEEATRTPAKTTVTALRRELSKEAHEESHQAFRRKDFAHVQPVPERPDSASAAEVGIAHHLFLQFAGLERLTSEQAVRDEATLMVSKGAISPEQARMLDVAGLSHFWSSELGSDLRANPSQVVRELPFTVRLRLDEIEVVGGKPPRPIVDGDFVVVQGVVDLLAKRNGELWILDFKTDALTEGGALERAREYAPQLRAYAVALGKIYRQPVTRCWLYFTTPRKLLPVALDLLTSGSAPAGPKVALTDFTSATSPAVA